MCITMEIGMGQLLLNANDDITSEASHGENKQTGTEGSIDLQRTLTLPLNIIRSFERKDPWDYMMYNISKTTVLSTVYYLRTVFRVQFVTMNEIPDRIN